MNKQEAIWYVNHTFEVTKEELCNSGRFDEAKEFEIAQNMAIKALQDDWIPVSERLPKVGEYVLASVHDHCADFSIIVNKYKEQAFWSEGRITAWQPLPEPYKGGDTE